MTTAVILPLAPRRRDAEATRTAILEAGKACFARSGYDRASLRDIAAAAGADVALIKRYFGGKEALFIAALKASFRPDPVGDFDRANFARDIATLMAGGPSASRRMAGSRMRVRREISRAVRK